MSRQVQRSTNQNFTGALRSIMFKRLPGKVTLWRDNKRYAEYTSDRTVTGVSLVFPNNGIPGNYPVGVFKLTGKFEANIELVSKDDVDNFDDTIHHPAFVL
jgi:hypothetical protein